jgi:putative tryptophan/tyrosine transport system substrate-binding protein
MSQRRRGDRMMRRREFIKLFGGAAVVWPLAARAQHATPVVGFLHAGSPGPGMISNVLAVFRRALAEAGYVEPQTVTIEFRYAEGQYDKLAELAADLVRREVSVIVATPNLNAAARCAGRDRDYSHPVHGLRRSGQDWSRG